MPLLFLLFSLTILSNGEPVVYLYERFDDGNAWKDRWVQSNHSTGYGKFIRTYGKYYANWRANMGIQTVQDHRSYALSRNLDTVFDSRNKTFVLQYSVKHEQKIECGGAYIKVLSAATDLNDFNSLTPYYIMFGPDICGYALQKVQIIFAYRGKYLEMEREIKCETDDLTHLYTLMLFPNLTYKVSIDMKVAHEGILEDYWPFLPQRMIKDPNAKPPDDWDTREMIIDVNDTKPDDWDKPETIPDPSAVKPDNWNDKVDGEWQPPKIPNPEYRGEWKPRQIKNPKYRGVWRAPYITNPDYEHDPYLVAHSDIGAVGFDIWQVKSGTIFDNILLTDDPEFAENVAIETWGKYVGLEALRRDEYIGKEQRKKREAETLEKKKEGNMEKPKEGEHQTRESQAAPSDEL